MAKYPFTKTLKKATPTIRTADNVVKSWEVEVEYAYAGDPDATDPALPAWKNTYSERKDVEDEGRVATDFTQAELMAMLPSVIDNHIFEAHYEAFNLPPAEERISDFDISTLS